MRKGIIFLLATGFAFTLHAQSFTAITRGDYHEIKTIYRGVDSRNFLFKTFYRNGLPCEKGKIKKGEKHGLWKRWNEDGTLAAVARYKNGKKSGTWRLFHEKEGSITEIVYEDNALIMARNRKYHPLLAMY